MELLKALSLVAICSIAPAYAQSQFDDLSAADFSVAKVSIMNETMDGCWNNLGEAKSYAEHLLRMGGVTVAGDGNRFDTVLLINLQAQRIHTGHCVGAMKISFYAEVDWRSKGVVADVRSSWNSFMVPENADLLVLDDIKRFLTTEPFERR